MGVDGVDDGVGGGLFFGGAARRRIVVVAEAVVAVKPGGVQVRARERLFGAGEDGNVRIAELGGVECVARGLVDVNVAGDRGDGEDFCLRRADGHDEGDGVVGGGVGVNEEVSFHAREDSKLAGGG